jgi:hypothetical protein
VSSVRSTAEFQRPLTGLLLFSGPVAQGDAACPQPQIGGVEVGGSQGLLRQPFRRSDDLAQIGQLEGEVGTELDLALLVRSMDRHP